MSGVHSSKDALVASSPQLLEILLIDRTTGRNIIWATDHYADRGPQYAPEAEITVAAITGRHRNLIQPRVEKTKALRWDRTKGKAEVFTPSWLCNEQNNRVDEAWFGRPDVFNTTTAGSWTAQAAKIQFDARGRRTWMRYVDERRLEVACGEAPYLVSRYDTTSGEPIALGRRIGLLDRKLRVVTENAEDESEWRTWVRRAFESVYGFEYQGDNLLLARKNLLATYTEYATSYLGIEPTGAEMMTIAEVISWNVWQMNALTGLPPLQSQSHGQGRLNGLSELESEIEQPCMMRDWRSKQQRRYTDLANWARGHV